MRIEIRPGTFLSYSDTGDVDAEPLVLIAGAGSTKDGWGPLPEALATRHRVLCFDARGLGASDGGCRDAADTVDSSGSGGSGGSGGGSGGGEGERERADGGSEVSMAAIADDVAALLDALGIARAHVLGWSFGSAVAQHFALRHPDRLAALVLWSTWARTDGYLRATFTGLRYPFAQGDLETAIVVLGNVFSPELLDSPDYPALIESMRPTLPDGPGRLRTTVAQWDANLAHDTAAQLPEITGPVLVVAGEQDTLAPPRYGRRVAGLVPDGRFHLFTGPGSSHALGLERMAEFSRLVLDFYDVNPIKPA